MNAECAVHPIDDLAKRARAGEARAATALMKAMRPYSGHIRRLALALRVDPDEAMGLLGLAITLALRSWDPARGHFATWTLWQARGLLSAQRPAPPMESWEALCEHQDPATGEEDDAEAHSPERELARRILNETPEFLRGWLQIRILWDHSQHQAAEALGLSHRQAMQMDAHLRRYFQRWEKEQVLV
jgi:hypothetical protein